MITESEQQLTVLPCLFCGCSAMTDEVSRGISVLGHTCSHQNARMNFHQLVSFSLFAYFIQRRKRH